jgi:beta-phosphoglucomutase-like phosphatase (HAD superfamily)
MPRSAHNNPTERILRLLDEMESLKTFAEMQASILARTMKAEDFEKLAPFPRLEAYISELTRQRLQHRSTVANRNSMARQRLRDVADSEETNWGDK